MSAQGPSLAALARAPSASHMRRCHTGSKLDESLIRTVPGRKARPHASRTCLSLQRGVQTAWPRKHNVHSTVGACVLVNKARNSEDNHIPKPCFASLSDKDDACPAEEGNIEPNAGKERKQGLRNWSRLAWE